MASNWRLTERQKIAKHMKKATDDLAKNTDQKKKAELVAETWAAFIPFFNEFMAGDFDMGDHTAYIEKIGG